MVLVIGAARSYSGLDRGRHCPWQAFRGWPMRGLRRRFWVETGLGALSALFLALTILWNDWIEIVFGVDPDHHNGSFEGAVVGVCALSTIVFALVARVEFHRGQPALT
jgi:hypothetical protein